MINQLKFLSHKYLSDYCDAEEVQNFQRKEYLTPTEFICLQNSHMKVRALAAQTFTGKRLLKILISQE